VAGMELEGEEGEPCDGQWSQADWSWTGRRVSGDRPYSGEAAGGHRGWEEEVADSRYRRTSDVRNRAKKRHR
jgi:hypothetical protein